MSSVQRKISLSWRVLKLLSSDHNTTKDHITYMYNLHFFNLISIYVSDSTTPTGYRDGRQKANGYL